MSGRVRARDLLPGAVIEAGNLDPTGYVEVESVTPIPVRCHVEVRLVGYGDVWEVLEDASFYTRGTVA